MWWNEKLKREKKNSRNGGKQGWNEKKEKKPPKNEAKIDR